MIPLLVTIYGQPITKKNSQQIVSAGGRPRVIQSKAYKEYSANSISQLRVLRVCGALIDKPVNAKYVYYMSTRRRVDLTNLMEATDDILVDAQVIVDDNRDVIASHDGSVVLYDKNVPRVEITLTEKEDYEPWH